MCNHDGFSKHAEEAEAGAVHLELLIVEGMNLSAVSKQGS